MNTCVEILRTTTAVIGFTAALLALLDTRLRSRPNRTSPENTPISSSDTPCRCDQPTASRRPRRQETHDRCIPSDISVIKPGQHSKQGARDEARRSSKRPRSGKKTSSRRRRRSRRTDTD